MAVFFDINMPAPLPRSIDSVSTAILKQIFIAHLITSSFQGDGFSCQQVDIF